MIFIPAIALFMESNKTNAQALSNKQKSIVAISAHTAKGNLAELKNSLNVGLDAGMTVNEIKEIFIQLAAYCGFPRSLNAINSFITVSNERKAKGIHDVTGTDPTVLSHTANKYETGKQNLEQLTGRPEGATKTGYAAFVPVIDTFLKEHLFADIFSRGILSNLERELITVSALTSMGGVEPQLQSHLSISMHLGLNKAELQQMLDIIKTSIGEREAKAGEEVLIKVIAARRQNN